MVAVFAGACTGSASGDAKAGTGSAATESSQEKGMNQTQPAVHLKFAAEGDTARLAYEVRNTLDQPIYVFDQLYDMQTKKLSLDWAYVAIEGQKAIISRQVWPLPQGLRHDSPELPYARLVAPKATLTGKFSLPLPLAERDPYYGLLHPGTERARADITSVALRIGWGVASQLHAGSRVELEGENLVLFPFHEALSKQRIVDSESAQVKTFATVSR